MSTPGREARAHLLIALSAESRDDFELSLCRHLVGEIEADLLGLLIEDARIEAHARSRLAREIVLSGEARRLEAATLERQRRARAAAMRRRFEEAAARLGWRHDFRVVRGDPLAELLTAAAEADVMILPGAEAGAGAAAWSAADLRRLAAGRLRALLLARPGWARGREIVAVLTGEADAALSPGSVLGTALGLANETHSTLTVVLAGPAAALAERVAAALPASGAEPLFGRILAVPDVAAVADALRTRGVRMLVLSAATAEEERAVAALLRLSSSLLWIR
ncbi:MAG TPA: hypothetical protein VFV10_09605 [Gammaproteobacteria bacterium]|nr:hypothetical protein [Gammaproteobacteria bacterium]